MYLHHTPLFAPFPHHFQVQVVQVQNIQCNYSVNFFVKYVPTPFGLHTTQVHNLKKKTYLSYKLGQNSKTGADPYRPLILKMSWILLFFGYYGFQVTVKMNLKELKYQSYVPLPVNLTSFLYTYYFTSFEVHITRIHF